MYNYADANSQQYIFEREPTKNPSQLHGAGQTRIFLKKSLEI